jgi:SOS response regulatory protein OraA/RecX
VHRRITESGPSPEPPARASRFVARLTRPAAAQAVPWPAWPARAQPRRAAASFRTLRAPPSAAAAAPAAAPPVERLLDTLVAQGLLSDSATWTAACAPARPAGRAQLAADCAQGLQPQGDTWQEVRPASRARQALLLRRFGEAPPDDARELARRVRFLLSRGFATALALRLVTGNRK